MRKTLVRAVGVLAVATLAGHARGADHADGTPTTLNAPDKSADITDVFAWTDAGGGKLNLVMDVFPGADATSKFSDAVKYVFHTEARPSLLGTAASKTDVICTFTTAQAVSCWVVQGGTTLDYVTGDASATAGLTSTSAKLKVFAGLRDDPFFFNLAGFKKAAQTVARAAAGLTTDANGCPMLDTATSTLLVGQLGASCTGTGSPVDFFKKPASGSGENSACTDPTIKNVLMGGTGNVLALVVQVDSSYISSTGNTVVGVWGATTH